MAGIHVLVNAAELALYNAKAAGRNRVVASSPPAEGGKLAAE